MNSKAGLEAFFDYIIAINSVRLASHSICDPWSAWSIPCLIRSPVRIVTVRSWWRHCKDIWIVKFSWSSTMQSTRIIEAGLVKNQPHVYTLIWLGHRNLAGSQHFLGWRWSVGLFHSILFLCPCCGKVRVDLSNGPPVIACTLPWMIGSFILMIAHAIVYGMYSKFSRDPPHSNPGWSRIMVHHVESLFTNAFL
jgi:hypothetical protein